MSYILEALKKAQAERQLGDMPTIHAAQVVTSAPAGASGSRKALLAGAAAGLLVAGVAATLFWRHQAPAQVAVAEPTASRAPQVPASAAEASAPAAPAAAAVAPAPTTVEARAPVASPAKPVAKAVVPASPVPTDVPAPHAARSAQPPAASERGAPSAAVREVAAPARIDTPAPAATAQPPAAGAAERAPAPPAPAEEYVRTLAELPENIRREVPKVAFGGYMYSPNAADRLVLVDKALRHEGDEVAPGLLLVKLLPKAAVLNYRGYVFRVGL
jgi:general secretion pathway protein B